MYNLPSTGLRFFTVYGPWGRPDMAAYIFVRKIFAGEPIDIFNYGDMRRDFTYIDDITNGIIRCLANIPDLDHNWNSNCPDPASSGIAAYQIFNIGNNLPVNLMDCISILENKLGRKSIKNYMPMQPGDVAATSANTESLNNWINFTPNTPIEEGVRKFIHWYRSFYEI